MLEVLDGVSLIFGMSSDVPKVKVPVFASDFDFE